MFSSSTQPSRTFTHKLQKHLAFEHALHVPAGAGTDLLKLRAAVADHDSLLTVTLDPDDGVDLGDAVGTVTNCSISTVVA